MTSELARKVGLKLFQKNLSQYAPVDPLYETYTDERGRERRRKREMPPGLSKRDQKVLRSVKRRAHYLDKGFKVCGMRFGWTFLIGIIPGAGDVTDAALNYTLVLRRAQKAELPPWLIQRMLVNNVISAGVGFVPLVGDVILAQWKANSRNAALLEEYLRVRGEEYLKLIAEHGGGFVAAVEGGDIRPGAGVADGERITIPHKHEVVPERHVPATDRRPTTPGGTVVQDPLDHAAPASAPAGNQTSSGGLGKWFKRKPAAEPASAV